MNIEEIYALIADDMARVNQCIQQRLQSEVVLINQIGHYIVNSGGKRLRPILHLLASRALGYDGQHHIECAALIEFIHTATLLHDDVVDASDLRRGQDTANAVWGNEASVLVGDFLYSRAFQMMVTINDMRVMAILADATNTIAEGEVQQLLNVHDADTSEERYLHVIHSKTAKLFESATQLAAVLSKKDRELELSLARYGMHLGTAFQLIDDVLDYSESSEEIGKNIGDDLAEGKPTLPLIYCHLYIACASAMRHNANWYARPSSTAVENTSTKSSRPLNPLGPSNTLPGLPGRSRTRPSSACHPYQTPHSRMQCWPWSNLQ